MQRYLFVILFVVTLLTPFALRAFMSTDDETTGGVAVSGEVRRLIIVSPHNQDIRREFALAFDEWHQVNYGERVVLDYRNLGGTNEIERSLADAYAGYRTETGMVRESDVNPPFHMVWGGGEYSFNVVLGRLGVLKPVNLPPGLLEEALGENDIAGRPLYERTKDGSQPRWVGVCLSAFGIVYSPPLIDRLAIPRPKTWQDLTGPELAGLVALADPTASGSAAVSYMMVIQRAMADAEEAFFAEHPNLPAAEAKKLPGYADALDAGFREGMRHMTLMAANSRYFTDSASQVLNDVGKGDAAAGTAIDFYGRVYEGLVGDDRIRYVSPAGATAINADPIAILYGVTGEDYELANRFIRFLVSPGAQRLWNLEVGAPGGPRFRELRRTPIRRDVFTDMAGFTDPIDPFAETGGFNQRNEWMGPFTDLREIWAAAFIDSRDTLKSSYEHILSIEDAARRAEAIEALSTLPTLDPEAAASVQAVSPISWKDALQARQRREEAEAAGDANRYAAYERIRLSKLFRRHYARVADEYAR